MNIFKKPNNLSEYEYYIQCAEKLGVSQIRRKVEKMLVLDFIIANEDRHFNNFGLLTLPMPKVRGFLLPATI